MSKGFSAHTLAVLSHIVRHRQVSVATLAGQMSGHGPDTITPCLSSLKKLGYVDKVRADKAWLWLATPKGRQLHARHSDTGGLMAGPRDDGRHAGTWKPTPWRPEVARPGCMDHVRLPSLMGRVRVYRKDAGQP